MRIFQDLDDEDYHHDHQHPDLSGSSDYYSSGCDSSTEDLGIIASSPDSSSRSNSSRAVGRGEVTEAAASTPTSTDGSSSSSTAGSARSMPSPRTVRFDLGGSELLSDEVTLSKKLTQTQVDLTTERTLRRRKEKTIVKLAKELNKRILEGEKKDKMIRELQQLLEEKETKLDSVLLAASSLLGGGAGSRLSTPSDNSSNNAVLLKRFLLEDALDQQAKKKTSRSGTGDLRSSTAFGTRRIVGLALLVVVSAAAAVGMAALTLGLDGIVLPKLF